MAEWVNVFEKDVLDLKSGELTVELENMGWHLFQKSSVSFERQERLVGAMEGEFEFEYASVRCPF